MDSILQDIFDFCVRQDARIRAELAFITQHLSGYFPLSDDFADVVPQRRCFLRDETGIHGIGHVVRVQVLAEILARMYNNLPGVNTHDLVDLAVVRRSAMAHDYRRANDGRDAEHGSRGAKFYLSTLAPADTASIDHELVAYSIEWHVPDDYKAPHITPELMILKDADGLDRVRIAHMGCGTNPDLLRTAQAPFLQATAVYLFRLGNAAYISNGHDEYSAVMAAAKIIGLVQH